MDNNENVFIYICTAKISTCNFMSKKYIWQENNKLSYLSLKTHATLFRNITVVERTH